MKIGCQDLQQYAKAWEWVNVSQKEVRMNLGDFSFALYEIGATWQGILEKHINSAPSVKAFTRRWEILLAKRS